MEKIMIVDDEEIFQFLAKSMLEGTYDVVCVSSGTEALSVFDMEKPDLILADLLMPEMTGLDLQEALKDKYEGVVPIVLMTSDDREESEIKSLKGGALDFIRKPFQKDILLRRVGNILTNISRIENLREEARTDLLTGLLNKSYSESEISECCRHGSGALMLFDLDSFKLVNDLVGHDTGDEVIIAFANILKSMVRAKDVAGRIGGDEFIVFCSNVSNRFIVESKVNRIKSMFDEAITEILGEDNTIPLGVSTGIVYVPAGGREYSELFKKADKALYNVKQNNKHGFCIYNEEDGTSPEKADVSLKKTRSILDERNEPVGAFELGKDGFRDVYRFLKRSVKNYHTVVQYGIFTLELEEGNSASGDISLDNLMEVFGVTLCHSLRCSDVYTRSSSNQYWVLLPESNTEDCIAVVVQRVMDNWKETGKAEGVRIKYEIEDI